MCTCQTGNYNWVMSDSTQNTLFWNYPTACHIHIGQVTNEFHVEST